MFLHRKRRVHNTDKVYIDDTHVEKNSKLSNDDEANHYHDHQQEDQILKIIHPSLVPFSLLLLSCCCCSFFITTHFSSRIQKYATLIIILLCTDEDAMRLVYYLYFESEHWIAAVDCKVMECFIFYFQLCCEHFLLFCQCSAQ